MKRLFFAILLTASSFAQALECDLNVSETVPGQVRSFQGSSTQRYNSESATSSARSSALNSCLSRMGATATCNVVATHCTWSGRNFTCTATVSGSTQRPRTAAEIKTTRCAKIEICMVTATLADNNDDVRILSNLRYNLNCQ